MPLSDHEQQLLDQLEKQLRSEDPRFASSISDGGLSEDDRPGGPAVSASRLVAGALGVVAGLGIAVGAIYFGAWPIGLIGFAVMVAGGYWALTSGGESSSDARPTTAGGGAKKARPAKGQSSSGGFMDRLEDRWERRQRGER